MVPIPAGSYVPFFGLKWQKKAEKTSSFKKPELVEVSAYWLDRYPVTEEQYLEFVRAKPEWQKHQVKRIFSDDHYLENWKSDVELRNPGDRRRPVTFISWFAAEAYCEWRGKELPTTDQWEYAAWDRGRGKESAKRDILEWYGKPCSSPPARIGSKKKNGFGVTDLFGLVWEWTLDFNSAIQTNEARDGGTTDENLFCGGGSQGAIDPTDYAAFMRFSFRNSLKANYTVGNLGFRCAKGVDHE
jgi:formylglycine-generating enzyme required for sulfatase activity